MKLVTIVFVTVLPLLKASQKDWNPIFVAFSGNGKPVKDAWFVGTTTRPIQADLTNVNRSRHLRSPIIDFWNKHNISKIKIELYSQNCMVAWMIFYGKGTTNKDWFDKDKLLHSSFDDESEVKNFSEFKLRSDEYFPFAITKWGSTCEEGSGVFIVFDNEASCAWAKHERYPGIMFTKNGTPRNWNTDADKADYMVIYMRT